MIERILNLMEAKGVKASKLTEDIGLNHSAISDWKKGKSKPSTDAIIKIANYFGVTTDYLLTGRETKLYVAENDTSGQENTIVQRRQLDFGVVYEGLMKYFFKDNRRYASHHYQFDKYEILWLNKRKESLLKGTGIPEKRIDGFAALTIIEEKDVNESDYPTFREFRKMMEFDRCNDEEAIELLKQLAGEYVDNDDLILEQFLRDEGITDEEDVRALMQVIALMKKKNYNDELGNEFISKESSWN